MTACSLSNLPMNVVDSPEDSTAPLLLTTHFPRLRPAIVLTHLCLRILAVGLALPALGVMALFPKFNVKKKVIRFLSKPIKNERIYKLGLEDFVIATTKNRPSKEAIKDGEDIKRAKMEGEKFLKALYDFKKKLDAEKQSLDGFHTFVYPSDKTYTMDDIEIKTSSDGVCVSMVYDLARQHLRKQRSWTKAIARFAKGAGAKVSGRQSLHGALLQKKIITNTSLDLLYLIAKGKTTLYETKNFPESAPRIEPGLYDLSLFGGSSDKASHAMLFHQANDGYAYLVDPNIGLMRCRKEQIQELFSKVLGKYPELSKFAIQKFLFLHNKPVKTKTVN